MLRTIREKDLALQKGRDTEGTEGQASAESFFDPTKQEFKEGLTPLMRKLIEAHECQCPICNPGFADGIREQANLEARDVCERSVLEKAQEQLYAVAIKKYKSEAKALALKKIRGEVKEEFLADLERTWTAEKKAAVKEEVDDQYDAMWVQMRKGNA